MKQHLDIINDNNYRAEHRSPFVELAPLPSSAQFLNVIESVFSGLARAVIRHSDYPTMGHCKAAIGRYFKERNTHFAQHPKGLVKEYGVRNEQSQSSVTVTIVKDPVWR